ncbi:signal recognition particle 72 kda [Moniliophthora roreri]|nr:signal recognition particle 72 kda [Moniliophthora roreri]
MYMHNYLLLVELAETDMGHGLEKKACAESSCLYTVPLGVNPGVDRSVLAKERRRSEVGTKRALGVMVDGTWC